MTIVDSNSPQYVVSAGFRETSYGDGHAREHVLARLPRRIHGNKTGRGDDPPGKRQSRREQGQQRVGRGDRDHGGWWRSHCGRDPLRHPFPGLAHLIALHESPHGRVSAAVSLPVYGRRVARPTGPLTRHVRGSGGSSVEPLRRSGPGRGGLRRTCHIRGRSAAVRRRRVELVLAYVSRGMCTGRVAKRPGRSAGGGVR